MKRLTTIIQFPMETNKTISPEQASEKKLDTLNSGKSVYDGFVKDTEDLVERTKDYEALASFIENCPNGFDSQAPDGSRYNPAKDASVCKAKKQGGFYVYYAFPNGSTSPVASFWATQDDGEGGARFKFIHIDLAGVVGQFITYYKNCGYLPPPPREYVKKSND